MTEQMKKRSYKSFGRDFISSALFLFLGPGIQKTELVQKTGFPHVIHTPIQNAGKSTFSAVDKSVEKAVDYDE